MLQFEVIIIKNSKHDNVVLMPQTVELYEKQLASLLSQEQYDEAVQILQFLMSSSGVDRERRMEMEQLLNWLYMMFPELQQAEFQEQTEDELRKQVLGDKWETHAAYVSELLRSLEQPAPAERQLITLERLAYHGGHEVIRGVRDWLTSQEMHPLLQFKGMQTLKQTGDQENIVLSRAGELLTVNLNDVPIDSSDIPLGIDHIFQKIYMVCETTEPLIGEFASQMKWDVIATSCGTSLYKEMSSIREEQLVSVWASALHALLENHIYGTMDIELVQRMYDITNYPLDQWMLAYKKCSVFLVEVER